MKSDAVRKGMQQAPHRSLFNALGMTKEEMERPLVGIVSSYNEIAVSYTHLDVYKRQRYSGCPGRWDVRQKEPLWQSPVRCSSRTERNSL